MVVAGLLFASTTISSCAHSDCSKSGTSGTVVGTLTSVSGENATFTVQSWTPTPGVALETATPTVGSDVVVRYSSTEIRFLHVGKHYSVLVYENGTGFDSGVHHADDNCSGGTIYANGKAIDTSLWSRTIVRRAIIGFVVFLVVLLVFLAWVTRRSRRRRTSTTVSADALK
jgi:hypothetical protein